jgi:hypothetical protein
MMELGYIDHKPTGYADLSHLASVLSVAQPA